MRLYRVLFVCIGNACRSQMAEAFASAYGSDVMIAKSAGLYPADTIPSITVQLMLEKNISLDGCVSKGFDQTGRDFDLIVNMSGLPLGPLMSVPVRDWKVDDPIRLSEAQHRTVRDRIEVLVQNLILELRRKSNRR
jgi:arsenate reductase (thioredoxin)